ncbi:hypothetical protein BDL97_11G021400 [Sphagnum fallax]|nr:hypothetical protein BDL97_11G021400 [Sphagnum fallax]
MLKNELSRNHGVFSHSSSGRGFVVQSWPSLVSLILCEVTISASDLHSLLLACPKLESFTLQSPNTIRRSTLSLTSSTLKAFQFHSSTTRLVDRIALEAGVLESLDLKDCSLEYFGLVGKGNLRKLKIKDAYFSVLDIGPYTSMLEVLHVSYAKIPWPGLGDFVSKFPNLKELRLQGLELHPNLKDIGQAFPHLNRLALTLNYEVMKATIDQAVSFSQHTSLLEKVVLLELESTTLLTDRFCCWVEGFLKVCPSLKRLVVCSNTQHAQGASGEGNPNSVGGFITSFVKLARKGKFSEIDIQYEDIKLSCSLWGDAGIKVRG